MRKKEQKGADAAQPDELVRPQAEKPWEDRSLSPEVRLESYKAFLLERVNEVKEAFESAQSGAERESIRDSYEKTVKPLHERLEGMTPEEFCRWQDTLHIELLGRNFLGAEAWRSQGIDVGPVPPIPQAITPELLNLECPLHPGEKIKDTHILVLVPKTVNGEPYTALKLDELCAKRKGSGEKLIYDGYSGWKGQDWAKAPQAESEWVLIPKSDPDRGKVSSDKHFRGKDIAEQQKVHTDHYREYREVKTLELMTAALLYDLVNKERLLPNYLRCVEPNASGGRVCVGCFNANGLEVFDDVGAYDLDNIGRALARKV